MSVKDAPSDRPIAGKDTATIFVSSTMSEETSDVVKRILNLALASFTDIKRPRPSGNVNENPRRRVLREDRTGD
jgi:hypothetical protein